MSFQSGVKHIEKNILIYLIKKNAVNPNPPRYC